MDTVPPAEPRSRQPLMDEVLSGMADWGAAHPQATFAEMEAEVETRLSQLRVRLLEDLALRHAAPATEAEAGACAVCGERMVRRGTHARRLQVRGAGQVDLSRPYQTCAGCGRGLFPPG